MVEVVEGSDSKVTVVGWVAGMGEVVLVYIGLYWERWCSSISDYIGRSGGE